jgi:predicted amidohydrolase
MECRHPASAQRREGVYGQCRAPMNSFKLALAQMPVLGGHREENLRRAVEYIDRATQKGASIVLLPEALDCGWCHESAHTEAAPIPQGDASMRLRDAARKHQIYVCAGLVERAGHQLFNSAVLFSPEGEVLLHHRKLNELAIAHHLYAHGDRLAVAHTSLGTIGVMICADAFAPGQVISRALSMMGAQLILSPCAWAVPPDHDDTATPYGQLWLDNYMPVARDFHLWIAGASNVGPITDGAWSGYQCIGNSLVVNPSGEVVLRGSYGMDAAALLCVDVVFAPPSIRADGAHEHAT